MGVDDKKNALLSAIKVFTGNGVYVLSFLIVSIVITEKYGLEFFGKFAVWFSVFTFFSSVKPYTWAAYIKFHPYMGESISYCLSLALDFGWMMVVLLLTAVFLILLHGISVDIGIAYLLAALIPIAGCVTNTGCVVGFFRYRGDFGHYSCLQTVIALLRVVSVSALCLSDSLSSYSVDTFLICLILVEALPWFFCVGLLFHYEIKKFCLPEWQEVKDFVIFAMKGMVNALFDSPIMHLDNVFIAATLGFQDSGVFVLLKRISRALGQFAEPIYQIVFPEFSRLTAKGDFKSIRGIYVEVTTYSTVFCILALLGVLCLLVIFKIGPVVGISDDYLWLFLGFLFAQCLAVCLVWSHPLIMALNKMWENLMFTGVANVVYVAALFCLMPVFGLWGVVISVVFQYLISVLLKSIYVDRMVKKKINLES